MLGKLLQFDASEFHQSVNFMAGTFEIFDAEGVDCYGLDPDFVADFQYLRTTKRD